MVKQLVQEWDQESVRDRRPLDPITLTPRAWVINRLHTPVYSTWKQSIKTLNFLKLKWEPCNIHLNQIIEMWSSQLCSFHLCFISSFFLTICAERERDVKIFYSIYLPLNCQQTAGCHYGQPDPDWHCWRLKGEGWWWGVPLPTPTTSRLCWMCCKKRAHVPNVRSSIAGAVL